MVKQMPKRKTDFNNERFKEFFAKSRTNMNTAVKWNLEVRVNGANEWYAATYKGWSWRINKEYGIVEIVINVPEMVDSHSEEHYLKLFRKSEVPDKSEEGQCICLLHST